MRWTLVLLSLSACGAPPPADDPVKVVEAFHQACLEGDYELAVEFCDESMWEGEGRSEAMDALRADRELRVGNTSPDVLSLNLDGERATVEARLAGRRLRCYDLALTQGGWRIRWWLDGTSPAWSEPRLFLPVAQMSVEDRHENSPELVVSLTADGETFVRGTRLHGEQRARRLEDYALAHRSADPAHLLLRIERSVPWREVSALIQDAAEAGLYAVSVGTIRSPSEEPTSPQTEGTMFRSLEYRIACFLPRDRVPPQEIDLVFDIGASGLAEDAADTALAALKGLCSKPEVLTVVITARPQIPWQNVIRAMDLAFKVGTYGTVLAASAPGEELPEHGLRVNGLTMAELARAESLPSPRDHPAMNRIIRVLR